MRILQKIYHSLLYDIPPAPPETGAILGMRNGIVCACFLDSGSVQNDRAIYTPNTEVLNHTIRHWENEGIQFCGIAHSHPPGQEKLSHADTVYINAILTAMPASISALFFPLVFPGEKLLFFLAKRQGKRAEISPDDIIIL